MPWHLRSTRHRVFNFGLPSLFGVCMAVALALLSPSETGYARILIGDSSDFSLAKPSPPTHTTIVVAPAQGDPLRIEPSSRGGSRSPNPDISTPEKFISVVAEAAQDSQRNTRVPASVTIAQAILESDWGNSKLASKAFNLFGIKAQRGPGPAGVIKIDTWEVLGGANAVVNDAFRAYHNIFESVEDHGHFLSDNKRYAAAFNVTNDPGEFARRIQAAGYATDPSYASKLIKLMDKYNLYQYDVPIP